MVNFDETTDIESVHDAKADDMIHDDKNLKKTATILNSIIF